MKATLEYNLPDEQDEFEKAVNGGKYAYIIWEIDHFLRANTKYAPDSMPDEVHKAYEDTRDKLRSLLTEHDLSIWENSLWGLQWLAYARPIPSNPNAEQ